MSDAIQAVILTGLLSALCSSYIGYLVNGVHRDYMTKAIDEIKARITIIESRRGNKWK